MLELEIDIELEGILNLEVEIDNTEIVIKEGFDQFDINLVNPTLSAGELVVPFSFNPSPQEDVTSVELWVNGSMIESRLGNSENPFTASGIVGAAMVQIRAYNNGNLIQQSAVYQLPIPNAADFDDFTFGSSKLIDVIAECSDPQNLPIEIKYLGVPTNGLVSLIDTDFISVQEVDRNNPTLIPYVIENSVGATDSGEITLHWEEISITIDTPTENQEIPSDEDITVAFTVTPAQQNYISAIALVVDGVEVEKRTPYSTNDFTITAGELSVDSHNIMLRAYDVNDEVVYNSQAVSVDVVASATRLLDIYPNQFGESYSMIQRNSNFTGDIITLRRDDNQVQSFQLDSGIIPISAMASFVGSGNGWATWWKGQANGLVVQQPNAANQPKLFENGILITENGLPALKFSGNQWLNGGDILNILGRDLISFLIGTNNGAAITAYYSKSISGSIPNRYGILTTLQQYVDRNTNVNPNFRFTIPQPITLINQVANNLSHKLYTNNTIRAQSYIPSTVDSSIFPFQIGAYNSLFGITGNISELHIYLEDVELDMRAINGLLNNDYGIY